MIKAVIFDCFGVLTQDGWLSFCQKYMTKENAEELRDVNHQVDRGMIDYKTFLTTVCAITGAPEAEAHAEITTTHSPNEHVFDLVRELKKAGYKLGVISNVGSELSDFLPHKYIDLFDEITLSYQVRAIKPEPKIYQSHLDQLNLQPEECVFIDDREPNIVGAQNIGMYGIWYQNVSDLQKELRELKILF